MEAAGGLVLLAASVAAVVWANVAGDSYTDLWATRVTFGVGDHVIDESLLHVVNDGLMTIFFFVIGLEVKRELTLGELNTRRAAALPLAAAGGGMLLPALLYLAVIGSDVGSHGRGIPIATDVAFAIGALASLGRRIPRPSWHSCSVWRSSTTSARSSSSPWPTPARSTRFGSWRPAPACW